MDTWFLVALAVVLLFGFVVFFGAPYLPTLAPSKEKALDLLDLKPGQTMLELGCGDGRVLLAAAKRGYKAVGYELNPVLAFVSRLVTWRYRRDITVIWGNFWHATWPKADGIFVFLLPKYMAKLNNKIVQEYNDNHVKLVSVAFEIPSKEAAKKSDGLFLYHYR